MTSMASPLALLGSFLLLLLGGAPLPPETTLRQTVIVQGSDAGPSAAPSPGQERVFAFGAGHLTVRDGDQTLRFDEGAGLLRWTDGTHGTRLETSLPLRPQALLGEVSTLRYLEQPPLRLQLAEGPQTRRIAGHQCREFLLTTGPKASPGGRLWVAIDLGAEGGRMAVQAAPWWRLRFPLAPDEDAVAFGSLPGPVLEYELTGSGGGRTDATRAVCAGLERGRPSSEPPVDGQALVPKARLTYQELLAGRLGPAPPARTEDEEGVLAVIRRFQDGYRRRDPALLDPWIAGLMAPDVFVVGTDGAWPGSWEWRGGHPAAREMFERDWRRWGSLRIFEDEMHLAVEGDAAWVVAFATVVREGGDEDASRRRAVARLGEYAESDWPSRRVLYEAMADAAQVLVQYERDARFVTPLRAEFGLVRRGGAWKIKMVHLSHPASGFRSFRLLNAPPDLVRVPGDRP